MVSPNILKKILYITKSDDETKFKLNCDFFFNSWKGQLGLQILTFQNGAQIILLPDIKGNM